MPILLMSAKWYVLIYHFAGDDKMMYTITCTCTKWYTFFPRGKIVCRCYKIGCFCKMICRHVAKTADFVMSAVYEFQKFIRIP